MVEDFLFVSTLFVCLFCFVLFCFVVFCFGCFNIVYRTTFLFVICFSKDSNTLITSNFELENNKYVILFFRL